MPQRASTSNQTRLSQWLAVFAVSIHWTSVTLAQSGGCSLVADLRDPTKQTLQCGQNLTLRTAPGASYHSIDPRGQEPPQALKVDRGAVEVEFHSAPGYRDFQILTPVAIAAVRGTKWFVDVSQATTSAFVVDGTVVVRRRNAPGQVTLRAGQGVDVASGPGELLVKHWSPERVQALMNRFNN